MVVFVFFGKSSLSRGPFKRVRGQDGKKKALMLNVTK
jgi:hypothetical protein